MLFTEFRFAVFFALVFGVYWSSPSHRARKLWLLAASYGFYAAWDWRFLGLILLSTLVDFFAAAGMATPLASRRKALLCLSLAINLGVLALFKYFDFFVASAVEFSSWLGLPLSGQTLGLILPLGISFYTFQTLSYTIDVYRGKLVATDSLSDFALFVAFFPQLVAGPIVRASEFLPQLKQQHSWRNVRIRTCLTLFLIGFIKKACVADHAAVAVDAVFASPESFAVSARWLGAFLYSLQIYCDFSGYSDMAIASAGLLGFRLPDNFAFPYLAGSMREFWRRWHISLSSWFRDYLYIPLGGNRAGGRRTAIHLITVFFLCGLWHGAAWTFVVWGLFHGFFLAVERSYRLTRLPLVLRHIYVVAVFVVGFVVFRATSLGAAGGYLVGLLGFGTGSGAATAGDPTALLGATGWILLATFTAVHIAMGKRDLRPNLERVSPFVFAPLYGAAVGLVLPWVKVGYQPFIYFQF